MVDKNTAIETYKFNESLHLSNLDFKKTIELIKDTTSKYDNEIAYIFYNDLVKVINVRLAILELTITFADKMKKADEFNDNYSK